MKRFYRQRKSFMTLLETLIALSLLSILLTIVFGFFRELSELSKMTEQTQKESFQMRYLESRLSFVFERLVNENATARTFYFYTQPPHGNISKFTSLIFTFNNEVRIDPNFSSDVLARLYVDNNQRLCLAVWPLYTLQPHQYLHEEVLMENVIGLNYEFYAAPEKITHSKDIDSGKKINKNQPDKNTWYKEEWSIDFAQMPSMIKLTIEAVKNAEDLKKDRQRLKTEEIKKYLFNFVLPSSKNPVQYPSAS